MNIDKKQHEFNFKIVDNINIDRTTFVGIIMIVLGTLLTAFASALTTYQSGLYALVSSYVPVWTDSWLSNLGTGLLASGILALILERASRKRHEKDIEDLKEAHSEAILKRLMPGEIFSEIQAHIIRQPFLRTNFKVTLHFEWLDIEHKYLKKTQAYSYDLENISQTIENYALRIYEEKRVDNTLYPENTKILKIVVRQDDHVTQYDGELLSKYIEQTPQSVCAIIPIALTPGQKLRVTATVENIVPSYHFYPFLANKPTIHMECTVIHPPDLSVRAVPSHPSSYAFIKETDTPHLKQWRLQSGVLPFQGIQLSWYANLENGHSLESDLLLSEDTVPLLKNVVEAQPV